MKLVTFNIAGEAHLGRLDGNQIVDLTASGHPSGWFESMQSLIEGGPAALDTARDVQSGAGDQIELDQVRLLAPLPRPVQIRDCLCFEEHLKNSFDSAVKLSASGAPDPAAAEAELRASGKFAIPKVWYQQPLYYKANRMAVAASGEDVIWPSYSNVMDFELEMGCIIGKGGKDIARDDADAHIFGYTIFNDFSARDAQMLESPGMLGPAKGKDFDKSIILGPVIVTADEMPDPYNLAMRAWVNGEQWCDGNSGTIHWRFADMIAHISQGETIYPGEVIGSGTVGWGCGLEHLRFLNDGDVVELEIEGIGAIKNRVVRAASAEA